MADGFLPKGLEPAPLFPEDGFLLKGLEVPPPKELDVVLPDGADMGVGVFPKGLEEAPADGLADGVFDGAPKVCVALSPPNSNFLGTAGTSVDVAVNGPGLDLEASVDPNL